MSVDSSKKPSGALNENKSFFNEELKDLLYGKTKLEIIRLELKELFIYVYSRTKSGIVSLRFKTSPVWEEKL